MTQHARAHGVLHALDRCFCRQSAENRFAQSPVPTLVVREHPVGFEDVAMLSGASQLLVFEHIVDMGNQLLKSFVKPLDFNGRIVGHQLRDDDAGFVQDHVPQRDAVRERLSLDDHRLRFRNFNRSARPGNCAGDQIFGNDHGGGVQNFDVLVGIFPLRFVLNDQNTKDLPRSLNRHGEERVIDFFARFRPVGKRRMA